MRVFIVSQSLVDLDMQPNITMLRDYTNQTKCFSIFLKKKRKKGLRVVDNRPSTDELHNFVK